MRNGFTLIELMLVLAIFGIITALGVPSFRALMADNQATSAANELLYALQVARTEAVKRNVMVSMCPTSDQITCTGNGNWRVGWMIFVDDNSNGARENTDEIIRIQNAFDTTVTLTGPNAIQYAVGGYLEPASASSIQASVTGSSNNKWVCVTAVGLAKVQNTSC